MEATLAARSSTGPFSRVRTRRAFEEVLLQVENAILSGELRPGDRLPPERELASVLGIGRPAVREALRVLEAIGVLEAHRGSGAHSGSIVAAVKGSLPNLLALYAATRNIPLADLTEVREALEVMGARLAARARDAAGLNELVEAMRTSREDAAFLALDTAFHLTIAKLSGNLLLPLLMEELREAVARRMLEAFAALPDPAAERRRLADQHAEIARAIGMGDGDKAADAVHHHIRGFYARFLEK